MDSPANYFYLYLKHWEKVTGFTGDGCQIRKTGFIGMLIVVSYLALAGYMMIIYIAQLGEYFSIEH